MILILSPFSFNKLKKQKIKKKRIFFGRHFSHFLKKFIFFHFIQNSNTNQ